MAQTGALLGCPVICIGNFTAGGAGKTPMALLIAEMLKARGKQPFFLSRGYGGTLNEAPVRVDKAHHTAMQVGDEPLLLAHIAPTIVGANRFAGAKLAIAQGADVLVMDDGLQNPALNKTLSFAMVDGSSGFGNGLCLPAGPLRAPLAAQWPHVAAIVVVGIGEAGDIAARNAQAQGKPCLRAHLEAAPEVAAALRGRRIIAFAGIGRPAKFFDTLAQSGADVIARHEFADHHRFTSTEMAGLQQQAASKGAILVTTQKDLARTGHWPGALQPIALPVRLVVEAKATLSSMLETALTGFVKTT